MNEYALERAYSCAYWRHNEFQLIAAEFSNEVIDRELEKLDRLMSKIVERLGFCPNP